MSEEIIQEIREYLAYPSAQFDEAMLMLNRLVPRLLAENATLREIAEAVAKTPMRYTDGALDYAVVPVELVDQASALLNDGK